MPTAEKAKSFAREWSMKITVLLGMSVILGSPAWAPTLYQTLKAIGENSEAIVAVTATVTKLAATVGGMDQIFGNAEIQENGTTLTASVNTRSDAGRYSQPGRRLTVINTGSRREMSVIVTVEGKFEGESHIFLNMSRAAGRAMGAQPGDEIQVAIEPYIEEKRSD